MPTKPYCYNMAAQIIHIATLHANIDTNIHKNKGTFLSKHKIVIVGGGFAGIKAALELSQDKRFHITLVSDKPDFRYYPTLFRTATGGRRIISSIMLNELFAGKSVHVIKSTVNKLDKKSRTIGTNTGHSISFDGLVLCIGTMPNYFGIKGLREYSYGIKSNKDAERLKKHLHDQLLVDKHPDLNYIVVGGGPTGVELSGVLPAYLREICKRHNVKNPKIHVDLVESAKRLLPKMPRRYSDAVSRRLHKLGVKIYLNSKVEAETTKGLMIAGKTILSRTVIWTAGVKNNTFFADQGFQLASNGRVRVDQYLQSDSGIYVIGDNADTPYSGMAQTALYDGKFLAKNLKRLADGKSAKPYYAKKPIYVIPAGRKWSAILWGKVQIYGRLGWLVRRAADLVAYHDYEPFRKATSRWMAEDDSEEPCRVCKKL